MNALELNALPYSTAPFAAGLTASDYREQHDEHGEKFRLWRALDVSGVNRSGKSYLEVELQSIGKGRFHSVGRDVEMEAFGKLAIGSTLLSCLPEVAELAAGDKVLRNGVGQERIQGATVVHGGGVDLLPHRFVSEICLISSGGNGVSLAQIRLVEASGPGDGERGGIEWTGGAPTLGARYFVLYKYRPFYVCLGEGMKGSPLGEDGGRLPGRYLLREERE